MVSFSLQMSQKFAKGNSEKSQETRGDGNVNHISLFCLSTTTFQFHNTLLVSWDLWFTTPAIPSCFQAFFFQLSLFPFQSLYIHYGFGNFHLKINQCIHSLRKNCCSELCAFSLGCCYMTALLEYFDLVQPAHVCIIHSY